MTKFEKLVLLGLCTILTIVIYGSKLPKKAEEQAKVVLNALEKEIKS